MELSVLAATIQGGEYVNGLKAIPLLVVLFLWARALTWADKDAPAAHLPRLELNLAMLLGGLAGFALFFTIPGFAAAYAVLVAVMLVEVGVYLVLRQRKVGLGDLGQQFRDWMRGMAKNPEKEVVAPAGEMLLVDQAGKGIQAPPANAPERPGYDAVQMLLTEPLRRGAERVDVTPGEGAAAVRFHVDGVVYSGQSIDRPTSAAAIHYLKTIAQMDTADRRKPQKGTVKASVDNHRHELEVSTAGSASGESLRVTVDPRLRHTTKLADLGFSADQLNLLRDSIADGTGIVLLTSPKGQGLTALEYALLSAHDAFISHIQTVERAPERDLDGITQNKLPVAATAAQELDMTNWVISQDTDVLLVAGLEDPKSAHQLSKFAKSGKRIYIGMRAPNTLDALLAWRKLVGDDTLAMQSLKMIIASRVVRRLCSACKIGYQPDPEQLRRLNMDPARVGQLYQARTEPMRDAKGRPVPCEFCHDLRFKGRLGFYEIFLINDDVRQVVMSGGSLKQLQAAFRKQRGKFLQEEALLHVESGATSVQEVLRVMRASEGQPPAPAAAAATAQRSG